MTRKVHILGIGGTFMAGVAVLARSLGYEVSGSDKGVYPPMSEQLDQMGISIVQGYDDCRPLADKPNDWVVGNVMRRGMPILEKLLNTRQMLTSGPEWLAKQVLAGKKVLAVSGTHGKTTTSSMLAWILEYAGKEPGFLIGGIPDNFGCSARLGSGEYFVIEADEYDSAFFDKRSKFVHYRPWILVINNIEFDHADIFPNLEAIQLQFKHVIRTIPSEGCIIYPAHNPTVSEVLSQSWSQGRTFQDSQSDKGWGVLNQNPEGSHFEVSYQGESVGKIVWNLLGQHNIQNALAALAAANEIGIDPPIAINALNAFKGVKRRLEIKGTQSGVTIYDDFAHHPTAIQSTLAALRAKVGKESIIAVVDLGSNTMKSGYHQATLADSVQLADEVYFFHGTELEWNLQEIFKKTGKNGGVFNKIELLKTQLLSRTYPNQHLVFMSNGSFGGIHQQMLTSITTL